MCDNNKNTYTFTWLVENYIHGMAKCFNSKEIRSPLFTTEHLDGATWYLAIRDVSDEFQDGVVCSLGRYSGDKGPDVVRVKWNLYVRESDNFSVLTEKEPLVIDGYGKGYSRIACKIYKTIHGFCLDNIYMNCYMNSYSSTKHPLSRISKGQTKVEDFVWEPLNVLEIKLHPGPKGLQYELFFHIAQNGVSIRIRRSDMNTLLKCYLMYSLSVNYGGVTSSGVRNERGWSRPFDTDYILEIPTSFNRSDFPQSTFLDKVVISGYFVTSIIDMDDCSKPNGKQEKKDRGIPGHKLNSSDILKYDLLQMYEKKIHTDVKLQIGNEMFHVHKCLLSSRSPVFSTMFEQDNQTRTIEIVDIDSNTLHLLLKYMYSSVLDDLQYESPLKLLLAAEKYKIFSLKEKCASYLVEHLSEENVCEVLASADMISHIGLKTSSINYIKDNADKVLFSENWKKFVLNNRSLVAEILSIIFSIWNNVKKIMW